MANEKLEDYPLYKDYMPLKDMFNRDAAVENSKRQVSASTSDAPLVVPTPLFATSSAGQKAAEDKLMQLKRPTELPKPAAVEIPQANMVLPAKRPGFGWINHTLWGGRKQQTPTVENENRPEPPKKRKF